MRLTLRTLLAYRDRVLNANELEDMHGRVQQSAMASNLVKRLESLSQRTNILAPPIEGKGLGADANSIAEYLDDSLKGDKVPELERICLESDVQLAELAQCHSLLSAALSTPVDVPSSLRQRVLSLSDEKERANFLARRQVGSPSTDESTQSPAPPPERQTPRTDSTGKMRFRTDDPHANSTNIEATGNGSANGQAAKSKERVLVTAQPVTAPMVASGGDSIRPSGLDLEGSHLAHEVPEYLRGRTRDGWLGPVAIGGLLCLLCLLVWQSIGSWSSVRDMFTLAPSEATPKQPDTAEPAPVVKDKAAPNANATAVPSSDSTPQPNAANPSIALDSKPVSPRANNDAQPQSLAPQAPAVAQWLPVDANAMKAVALVQTGGLTLHRLQPSESLPSSSQIFVPSANRPKLDITRGPQWQVCGTTHAMLILPDTGPTAQPQIDLRLGRAVVSAGREGNALSLLTPAGNVYLSLSNGASAAIEVSYVPQAHGAVTNRAAYVPTLSIVSLEGEPSIEINKETIKVATGHKVNIQSSKSTRPEPAEAPLWIDSSFDRPVDIEAAKDLNKQLAADSAIGEVLQSLATNRRPETRAIAAQTLALLNNWDWVAQPKGSLSDVRDRTFWAALLDRTRQILAAHPEYVDTLGNQLKQLDPGTAQWRLALWLGLDAGQLQAEEGKKIVASLENEALIERILAIQQLQRATGKDLGYQAGEPNRTIVGQWTRELSSAKLPLLPLPKS